jgi:hypothetical protein
MVDAAMAFVEGACVAAVEVPHAVGEVRNRSLHDQVVVVAEQAGDVDAPAVPALHPSHDVGEDHAIPVVQHDRSLVVAPRRDVVIRAGLEVSPWTSHGLDGSDGNIHRCLCAVIRHTSDAAPTRARHVSGLPELAPGWTRLSGTCL